MEPPSSSESVLIHHGTHRSASAPFSGEMMSNPVSASTTTTTNLTACSTTISQHNHHQHDQQIQLDSDAGNQSDSSGNSNSSLASSANYNERYPRPVVGKSGRSTCGSSGNGAAASRGSFALLGSRTSLPPLNENCLLDATESQLALNLRRATRSTSWTNQKILDVIDGLNTCEKELDPCLALGVAASGGGSGSNARKESPRCSFEKFVVPKSISNLIMQSRSSGSVNPTSGQNRENSCYNFLCGITEDEDEEPDDCNNKHSSSVGGGGTASFRLPISQASTSVDEKCKHIVAGGKAVEGDPLNIDDGEDDGAHVDFRKRSRNGTAIPMKKVMIQENNLCSDRVISTRSEMDSSLCSIGFDKQHNNAHNSLYSTGKKERPSAYQNLHNTRLEEDDEVPTQ
ncbi:unnamed protein product [Orchesella dallaii]|uniref:Uncharacterized protein n=1 Tax=Orchesella dallaii TaxID=48710 RepID=A0ABP1S3G2_9HEXA